MIRLTGLLLILCLVAGLVSCGTGSAGGDAPGVDVPAVRAGEGGGVAEAPVLPASGEQGREGGEPQAGGAAAPGGEPGEADGMDDSCTGCPRRARLEADPGQGETGWEDWLACMAEHMTGETFDPDDPEYERGRKACEQYEPPGGGAEVMNPSSVLAKLAQTTTSACFHMAAGLAEYEFRYSWDTGLEGEQMPNGKPVASEFGLELEFRGEPEEIIQAWFTQSSVETVTSHYSRMFDNPGAELRKDLPLEEMLWDFEKTPDTCEIEPDKDEVEPEELMEVELSGFESSEGEASREFNRILVEADEGTIHGGTGLKRNPYMRVFVLGDGEVSFTYEAPDSTEKEEDTIRVYSSCEILTPKEQPLDKTYWHEQIADKTIRVKRPTGWIGTIQGTRARDLAYSGSSDTTTIEEEGVADETITIQTSLQYDHADQTGPGDIFAGSSYGTYAVGLESVLEQYTDGSFVRRRTRSLLCSGNLEGDDVTIILGVDRQAGTYELNLTLSIPGCEGTEETELVGGHTLTQPIMSAQLGLGDGGAFFWSGRIEAETIAGAGRGAGKDWTYELTYYGE